MKALIVGNENYLDSVDHAATLVKDLDTTQNDDYDVVYISKQCTSIPSHFKTSAKVMIVESSYFKSVEDYEYLKELYPGVHVILAKPDQYRDDFDELEPFAALSSGVTLVCAMNGRDYKDALSIRFDIMPRLLGIMAKLIGRPKNILGKQNSHCFTGMGGHGNNEYDSCSYFYTDDDDNHWKLQGMWSVLTQFEARFTQSPTVTIIKDLGLCPNQAYVNMFEHYLNNVDNDAFWEEQYKMDVFILQEIA